MNVICMQCSSPIPEERQSPRTKYCSVRCNQIMGRRAYRMRNLDVCNEAVRRNKRRKYERVDQIKLERGCADCGYDEYAVALDFDHLPQYSKTAPVSALLVKCAKWSVIQAEIDKCDVVCATCHRVRTYKRGKENGG